MDNSTGKLREIGEMALLLGGPRRRGAKQGECQGLMVCEKGKYTSFLEKMEMADREVGS